MTCFFFFWFFINVGIKTPRKNSVKTNRANNNAIALWQQRWSSSVKGRWTYSFFPCIKTRLQQPIWLTHHITQILTGHGDFNEKLASFRLVPSPVCPCGESNESAEHIFFTCQRFIIPRQRLELALEQDTCGHILQRPLYLPKRYTPL